MKHKKILVVDDDESILDAISLILTDEGYTVKTTFKGDNVYNTIDTFKPHLILLDVLMSGNDGRHICNTIKTDIQTKNIPVIMISAHPAAKEGSVQCHADDFLAKPFDVDDLLQTVAHYTK